MIVVVVIVAVEWVRMMGLDLRLLMLVFRVWEVLYQVDFLSRKFELQVVEEQVSWEWHWFD